MRKFLTSIASKFQNGPNTEKKPEEEIDAGARRRFFKQGLLGALAVGGISQLPGSAHGQRSASASGSATATASGSASASFATAAGVSNFGDVFRRIKSEATPEELFTFLYDMPKGGDIHHHLAGGFLPEMWYEIATDKKRNGGQEFYTRYKVLYTPREVSPHRPGARRTMFWTTFHEKGYRELPDHEKKEFKALSELTDEERQAWLDSIVLDRSDEGRDEFFEYIWPRLNHILRSIHVMTELAVENMKRFGAEGVRYLELMTGLGGWYDENQRMLSRDEVTAFWVNRLSRPDAVATGVQVRFKHTVLRFDDDALERVEDYFSHASSDPHDLWVGIDMAGREDNNKGHPRRFTEIFDRVLRKYPDVGISIHAGESEKYDSHIFDTLRLGANRIGHGINLFRDEPTMQLMRCGKFLVEINLISNHLLGYVPDPADHPFPIYLRQGIPCCLNTDDRGMWHSNMTDEYFVAVSNFNLSWEEILRVGRNSLKFAFAPKHLRKGMQADFEKEVVDFERRYSVKDWRKPLQAVKPVTYDYGRKHLGLRL